MNPIDKVLEKLPDAKINGHGWKAICPAHEDRNPSLSVSTGDDGRALLHCHAGCEFKAIVAALGMNEQDLFIDSGNGKIHSSNPWRDSAIAQTYDYRDADGVLAYQTVKFDPKDFRQRRSDGSGHWIENIQGVDRILYNLAAVIDADTVYVVEGEKSADYISSLGVVATTAPLGAGKWMDVDYSPLIGKDVIVLPDNDEAGLKHANDIVASLGNESGTRRIVALPSVTLKSDPADWIEAGGTREDLEALVAQTEVVKSIVIAQSPAEWEWTPYADVFNPRPPIEYVVDKYFSLPSLNIVYGAPGCMKSMVMADCAVAVASGMPWLPADFAEPRQNSLTTKRVPVLWIDFDNGMRRTTERFEAMGNARDLKDKYVDLRYVSLPMPQLSCDEFESIGPLIASIAEMGAKFIIIDNLGTVSGSAEENSSAMKDVMGHLRLLAETTGAAVVVIHHQRKGANDAKVRLGETLRGHSSIEASLDMAFLVHRTGESMESGNEIEIKCTKSRGMFPDSRGAQFEFVHRTNTEELWSAHFTGNIVENIGTKMARVFYQTIESAPGIVKGELVATIKDECSISRNKAESFIDRMVQDGKATVVEGARNAKKFYSVDDESPSFP